MSAPRLRTFMGLLGVILGGSLFACVDKAPPATWPEPPPPVMAKPVGGDAVQTPVNDEPAEPSQAVEGTNDPKEGAVGLDGAPAEATPEAAPESEAAPDASPSPDARPEAPAPNP